MIERDATAEAIDRFRFLFDRSRVTEVRARADHARTLLHERRFDGARDAFAEALEVAPNDWALLEEAAEFTTYIVRDLGLGAELARRALTINPIAPGVWNILGDCELHQGRPRAALNCYRRAIELNPHEVRGRYNASYALSAQRDIPGALQMTAEGLALDSGTYRDRLLRRQARLLDRLNQP